MFTKKGEAVFVNRGQLAGVVEGMKIEFVGFHVSNSLQWDDSPYIGFFERPINKGEGCWE